MTASLIHHIQAVSTIRFYSPAFLFHSTLLSGYVGRRSQVVHDLLAADSHILHDRTRQWQGIPRALAAPLIRVRSCPVNHERVCLNSRTRLQQQCQNL